MSRAAGCTAAPDWPMGALAWAPGAAPEPGLPKWGWYWALAAHIALSALASGSRRGGHELCPRISCQEGDSSPQAAPLGPALPPAARSQGVTLAGPSVACSHETHARKRWPQCVDSPPAWPNFLSLRSVPPVPHSFPWSGVSSVLCRCLPSETSGSSTPALASASWENLK